MKIPKVYAIGSKRHSRQWKEWYNELLETSGGQNNGIDYIAYYWETGRGLSSIRFIKSAKFLWRRINRKINV